jgi:hypothetical protein
MQIFDDDQEQRWHRTLDHKLNERLDDALALLLRVKQRERCVVLRDREKFGQ